MPVDTKARYYAWYMTEDHNERIVAFEWWPKDGEIISSMTTGKLVFKKREEPGATWGPPETVMEDAPWVVAQSLTRRQGFNVEVANG